MNASARFERWICEEVMRAGMGRGHTVELDAPQMGGAAWPQLAHCLGNRVEILLESAVTR